MTSGIRTTALVRCDEKGGGEGDLRDHTHYSVAHESWLSAKINIYFNELIKRSHINTTDAITSENACVGNINSLIVIGGVKWTVYLLEKVFIKKGFMVRSWLATASCKLLNASSNQLPSTIWCLATSKPSAQTSKWAIMPDGGIVCELFKGRVHTEFGLLLTATGDHLLLEPLLIQ